MSYSFILSALLLGMGTSLHCVGMCSPLQFAVLMNKDINAFNWRHWITYQSSRIGVYALYGMLFGWIGSSIRWFGIQQNISLTLGIFILTSIMVIKLSPSIEKKMTYNPAATWLRKKITPFIFSDTISSKVLAGILNGMLPCGMVYVALAGATAMQSTIQGAIFMMAFGAGTVPLLLATALLGNIFQSGFKSLLNRWYPYLIGLVAILLIARGLNMGHGWSPKLTPVSKTSVQCSVG